MQSRAIPAATDGLKAGGRRVLWTARDGHKWKSASLAGATMPIHPHDSPEGAINTLAAPYNNNIPLFHGDGAFGTLLDPTSYGASRYTSVKVSQFTQDVVFCDLDIVPMMDNYDGTIQEPMHFLPLVPITLLNPTQGIAVGFATKILPHSLDDIILAQLTYLGGSNNITDPIPKFTPLDCASHKQVDAGKGTAFYFSGDVELVSANVVRITKLPYGMNHADITSNLDVLCESGTVVTYDDLSRDVIDIVVKFTPRYLANKTTDDIIEILGLTIRIIENLTVLNFDGKSIWTPSPAELIMRFTDWRLKWYVNRYERLKSLLTLDLQRYYDIRTAITNDISGKARSITTRQSMKDLLATMGVVHIDYIADLPVYRFTKEEYEKNEKRIKDGEALLAQYNGLLASEPKRKKVYIKELQDILQAYTAGKYNTK
jgi:DNA gyrase/topoisomerase IV subunit A